MAVNCNGLSVFEHKRIKFKKKQKNIQNKRTESLSLCYHFASIVCMGKGSQIKRSVQCLLRRLLREMDKK